VPVICWPEVFGWGWFSGSGDTRLPGCRAGWAGFHGPGVAPFLSQ